MVVEDVSMPFVSASLSVYIDIYGSNVEVEKEIRDSEMIELDELLLKLASDFLTLGK